MSNFPYCCNFGFYCDTGSLCDCLRCLQTRSNWQKIIPISHPSLHVRWPVVVVFLTVLLVKVLVANVHGLSTSTIVVERASHRHLLLLWHRCWVDAVACDLHARVGIPVGRDGSSAASFRLLLELLLMGSCSSCRGQVDGREPVLNVLGETNGTAWGDGEGMRSLCAARVVRPGDQYHLLLPRLASQRHPECVWQVGQTVALIRATNRAVACALYT